MSRTRSRARSPRLPARSVDKSQIPLIDPMRRGKAEKMGTWLRALAYRGGGIPDQTVYYYNLDGSCVCWSSEDGSVTTIKEPRTPTHPEQPTRRKKR